MVDRGCLEADLSGQGIVQRQNNSTLGEDQEDLHPPPDFSSCFRGSELVRSCRELVSYNIY